MTNKRAGSDEPVRRGSGGRQSAKWASIPAAQDLMAALWPSDVIGVVEMDRHCRIAAANPWFSRLIGTEATGLQFEDLVAVQHKARVEVAVATAMAEWQDFYAGILPWEFGTPTDARIRLRAVSADKIIVLVEQPVEAHARVAQHLASVVEDLVDTHREMSARLLEVDENKPKRGED